MTEERVLQFEKLEDFDKRQLTFQGRTKDVYVSGEGPAIIVMSEIPGIYQLVADFARRVRSEGFTVWMPDMFGKAGKVPTTGYMLGSMARACISREFRAFSANKSSPIVDWLRALAKHAHEESGGKGVGAIGMCFTGNFAFNLMLEPSVLAPVLSQPSLPIGKKGGIHASPEEIRCIKDRLEDEDLTVLGYCFEGDDFCQKERFDDYKQALGDRFIGTILPAETARQGTGMAPHSVVTHHLIDEAGEPTRKALDEILAFYHHRLKSA
ncbi:MAG: dienelactone hydrolase family protein [Pseudomonadales bacterium]|nr:dienelactone hydrolase family protein [Pseudomonadales bacterium]MBO6565446.1 dienelactone hydrolase family protein [Pseudomonadales bacterium]MBO6596779.1 dienelactone hydrolase family protein [Pseudomonadales bacterium]MBO6823232.1 dienelactone hydrolase family protein [Pseudomonadales bacterium]